LIRLLVLLFAFVFLSASADDLEIDIRGVKGVLADNVMAHVGSRWVSGTAMSTPRRRDRFMADAKSRARAALRPYGYYAPTVEAQLHAAGVEIWRLEMHIEPGAPVTVRQIRLELTGPGATYAPLLDWKQNWPLQAGARLDQPTWEEQKETALGLAQEQGYLGAAFTTAAIALDLEANRADLALVLDTGPRAVMGEVRFSQSQLEPGILAPIPRFRAGDPYQAWLVSKLRTDLWRTGYWDDIDVVETRKLDQDPPVVDFEVRLEPGKLNTHQGTIGYGTDTEFRMQYRWQRDYLSHRGDTLGAGFGWQSRNEEVLLFGEYRLPRQVSTVQYWQVNPIFRRQHQDLVIEAEGAMGTERFPLASSNIDDFNLRLGRAKLRNLKTSREQVIETVFAQYLREDDDLGLRTPARFLAGYGAQAGEEIDPLDKTRDSLAFGMEWDWPVVEGRGFGTRGHRERAWVFTSNEAWGSEVDYSQIYLSSRWEIPLGQQWKLLLRGEAGYSDAEVIDATLELEDRTLQVSLTQLPYLYRFKAGGSRSVRGYDFEELSTNGIGSNHILTVSVEVERAFRENWSAAAFIDSGNAFNDWGKLKMKTGVGFGIRWYSPAGAVRLDLAQARDIPGHPWRLHITVGTPLL